MNRLVDHMRSSRRGLVVVAALGLMLGLVATTNSTAASASDYSDGGTAAAVEYINAQDTGTVTEISAGNYHSCAITTEGFAYCWGTNTVGQLGARPFGQPANTPIQVEGVDLIGYLEDVQQISAGGFHTCAIVKSGTAYCWGLNTEGQLGTPENTNVSNGPVVVADLEKVTDISAGYRHTCAVDSGTAYCWGSNNNGQLGNDTQNDSSVPVRVCAAGVTENDRSCGGKFLSNVKQISAGGGESESRDGRSHTCAVTEAGAAFCWGSGEGGRLGNGLTISSPSPVQVKGKAQGNTFLSDVTQIATGDYLTCAIGAGDVGPATAYCWGRNTGGVGNGTSSGIQPSPAVVLSENGFPNGSIDQISVGGLLSESQTCAVTEAAVVFCWGSNAEGQLGNPDFPTGAAVPVPVKSANRFDSGQVREVSAGGVHTCARTEGGAVFCWGANSSSQLGNGTPGNDTDSDVPVPVAGQLRVDPKSVVFGTVASGKSKEENVVLASSFPLSSGAIVIDITEKPAGSNARRGFSFSPEQGCDKQDSDTIRLTDGTQCTGVVEFAPTQPGTYGGKVLLQPREFPNVGVEFAASGYSPAGSNPGGPVVKAGPVDFGKVDIFTAKNKKVKIKNTGDEALKISGAKVRNDPQDEFDVKLGECGDSAVPPGKTCQLKVQFFPRVVGESTALLELKSNSVGSATIALSGEGISNPPLTDEQGRPVDEDGNLLSLGPVRKLSAKAVMTKKAVVQWKRPKTKLTVTQYEARVKQCVKKRGSWNCNKPKWRGWQSVDPDPNFQGFVTRTYKKLMPATKYKVQARALSYDLLGEKSAITVTTKKSGIPTKAGNG